MSQNLQRQMLKNKSVQEVQLITRYLDSMNNTLSMINRYKKSIETFSKNRTRDNKKMIEALNFGAAQSCNSMGVEIQLLMKEKNGKDCLKLLKNQFIDWVNDHRSQNNNKQMNDRIEPLINFIIMAFKGEKLPDVPSIVALNKKDEGFNQENMNRRVHNLNKSKEKYNRMDQDVRNNKNKYEKKYYNELNNKKTDKNGKLISNYKTNKNMNGKSLLKDVNNIYRIENNNNNYSDNDDTFINAPDLLNDNENSNNGFHDTKIDLKYICKGKYIDFKAPSGIYYNCYICDIDKYNNKLLLQSKELNKNKKFSVNVNNNKFAKSQSMSNRPGKVLFNHLYFSNKNRWTIGFINSFNNGYINIDTCLNQPQTINIHINDSRYVKFDFEKTKDKDGDSNMNY